MPAESPDQQAPRSQEVFISYSRKDKEFVRRLDEELKRRDREAWVDWEGIPPGDTWEKTIYGAIEATHTFIFVLTPDSIASEVCGREIAHAAANNKRLVPIVHRDVVADSVPKSLRELNWIFYRDSDDFEKATDTLISALDTDLKWIRAHTRLLTRAIEWDANGRNNSFVLRGEDLRSGERWLAEAGAQKERQPTPLQTEFIITSRKAAARRQRIISAAVSFALILSIVLTVIALTQCHQAVEQKNIALSNARKAEQAQAVAVQRQRAAEQRLKELCQAWKAATAFIEDNLPAGIYDMKSRLDEIFHFEEECAKIETTTATGTITEYSPGSTFVVKETSGPVSYRYGEKVTYVTRSGKTLTDDEVRARVKVGTPVNVWFSKEGNDRIINRVEIDDD
jgi:Tfp pilus assembly protein PilX